MTFKDKYTPASEKDKPENKNKKVISDDAYAIGDIIQSLMKEIERARING